MFAIVRVRGFIKVNVDIETTMKLLNLTRANHCVLYAENKKIKGMLNKARGYITWGEISSDVLKKLLSKRAYVYSKDGKLVKFKKMYSDEKQINEVVENILNNKKKLKDYFIKPVFRLSAPSKGFERKGIKKTYNEGGVLGYRKENINKLLLKMI